MHIDIADTDQSLESIESILIVIERSTLEVLDMSRIIPNSYYTRYNMATLADDLGAVLEVMFSKNKSYNHKNSICL